MNRRLFTIKSTAPTPEKINRQFNKLEKEYKACLDKIEQTKRLTHQPDISINKEIKEMEKLHKRYQKIMAQAQQLDIFGTGKKENDMHSFFKEFEKTGSKMLNDSMSILKYRSPYISQGQILSSKKNK